MATKNIRLKLGQRCRQLRIERDLSQEKFADMAGMHRTYVGSIERGEQNVSIDNIAKIAATLKVSLAVLFKGL